MACGGRFESGISVPIRTIGFEYSHHLRPPMIDITQTTLSPHTLRIYNRHLDYIKANKLDFIPVSHVWHEKIAQAQDHGCENIQAA